MIIERFDYKLISRNTINGKRLYSTPDGSKLVSVTTILDKTKPQKSVDALNNWRKRVGVDEARRITSEAANVGTLMHKYLEEWLITDTYSRSDNMIHRVASNMADTVIENISPYLDEIWGTEVGLYYPGLYAGTADVAGIWKQKPAIMDFKQSNRLKKKEWIDDYFLQTTMYAEAHNELFDTNIESVAIFICTRDCEFQLFEASGDDYKVWAKKAVERIEQYYC
jgi:genome maintenance exonuclease 1